jgi:putative ABC transport system permease protein
MLCILASTALASILNLALSVNIAFNEFDVLKEDVVECA